MPHLHPEVVEHHGEASIEQHRGREVRTSMTCIRRVWVLTMSAYRRTLYLGRLSTDFASVDPNINGPGVPMGTYSEEWC